NRADDRIARQAVLRRQRLHLVILPANQPAPGRDPRRSVGIDRQVLISHLAIGRSRSFWQWKDLQPAIPVAAKIAIFEAQPDAAGRIGRDAPHQRNTVRSEFLLNAQIADAEQLAIRGADIEAHPDVVLPIFRDRGNHSEGTAIEPMDAVKLVAVENAQRVAEAGPQSPRMILPEGVRAAAGDWHRRHVVPAYGVQTLRAGDPD